MSLHDRAETLLVRAILGSFAALSSSAASNLGGAIMRTLGPMLPSHRVVRENLRRALPELSPEERRRIGREAWENLGRVLAELVHLPAILQFTPSGPGLETADIAAVTAFVNAPTPAILFSAHIANWELLLPLGTRLGGDMAGIYRAPQRPGVTAVLTRARHAAAGRAFSLFPKGARGGRDAFAFLRNKGKLGLLIDQKLNEGIEVPFFGLPAMTATAAAKFALHFRCGVTPFHTERLGPARYRLVMEQALPLPATGDAARDTELLTAQMTAVIEGWIRARPGEWLWMHRRWRSE